MAHEPVAPSPAPSHPEADDGLAVVSLTSDQLRRFQRLVEVSARRLYRLGGECDGNLRRGLVCAADDLAKLHVALNRHRAEDPRPVTTTNAPARVGAGDRA